ncbi:hypothetical protein C0993_004337 [Termitomyces sp. T159_Od127]|nr:hypothetical protein C0993_004337 [Termitomyces sp. T159_Od127]
MLDLSSQGTTVLQGLVFGIVALFVYHYAHCHLRSRPPGPRGYPIIGNALDLQRSKEGDSIAELGKIYGDVVYMEVFGKPFALLNNQGAIDLLDKRGQLYSDRPHLPMAADFSGMADLIPIVRHGEKFQFGRRLMNQALSTRAVSRWQRSIAEESRAMLTLLHKSPAKFIDHLNK